MRENVSLRHYFEGLFTNVLELDFIHPMRKKG